MILNKIMNNQNVFNPHCLSQCVVKRNGEEECDKIDVDTREKLYN